MAQSNKPAGSTGGDKPKSDASKQDAARGHVTKSESLSPQEATQGQSPAPQPAPEMPSGTNPVPAATDPGDSPGRYDPNQATGSDMPLTAENAGHTKDEALTDPAATTGGAKQSGPYSGTEAATAKPTADARRFSHVGAGGRVLSGGMGIADVLRLSREFVAAVRARNVSEMARCLGEALTAFAGSFGGGTAVAQSINPQEIDAAIAEFDALKGEVPTYVAEFQNPQFYAAGGHRTGAQVGMAKAPQTAGLSPGEIMAWLEVFGNVLSWFRNRNAGR